MAQIINKTSHSLKFLKSVIIKRINEPPSTLQVKVNYKWQAPYGFKQV